MMNKPPVISPKAIFQQNEIVKKELGTIVHSGNFQMSLSSALSEFIVRCDPTQEECRGVRKFIAILNGLPFEDAPLPDFPVRKIDQTVFSPPRPVTTPK